MKDFFRQHRPFKKSSTASRSAASNSAQSSDQQTVPSVPLSTPATSTTDWNVIGSSFEASRQSGMSSSKMTRQPAPAAPPPRALPAPRIGRSSRKAVSQDVNARFPAPDTSSAGQPNTYSSAKPSTPGGLEEKFKESEKLQFSEQPVYGKHGESLKKHGRNRYRALLACPTCKHIRHLSTFTHENERLADGVDRLSHEILGLRYTQLQCTKGCQTLVTSENNQYSSNHWKKAQNTLLSGISKHSEDKIPDNLKR